MAATIRTKDGKEYRCLGQDADEIAEKANAGAKLVKCGRKWIAVSDISTVSIKSPDDEEDPASTSGVDVTVHHHHYYNYSDPRS